LHQRNFPFLSLFPRERHGTACEIEPNSFRLKSGLHENALRTGQKRGMFVSFARCRGGEETEKHGTTLTTSRCAFEHVLPIHNRVRFSALTLPFDSHGVIHPTPETKALGPTGLGKVQKAAAAPQSAASAPDGVGLDESTAQSS
jgi:hypothetical protein